MNKKQNKQDLIVLGAVAVIILLAIGVHYGQ